jgi:hypothetical protein
LVGAKIGGDLYCDGASFRSEKDAYGKPGMALSAYGARISGGLFLKEGASLAGVLDLTAAEFGTINDDPQCWPGKGDLVLNRCRYGAFVGHAPVDAKSRLAWLGRQDATDFRPQPYQQLASVLREMGHDDAAKTVLVAKERARRAAELRRMAGWRKPLHWVWTQLLRMVGYGYRPALAFVPALAVVLVGWGVIDRAAGAGLLLPAKRAEAGAPAAALMPLAYSFEAFVPVVTLGQVEAFRPDMGTRWGRRLQIYLWLHGLAGWLIGGIAAAGVLGLFRRE